MKSKFLILSIGLSVLLSAGCVSTGNKLDQSKVSQIKKGVTTRAEVEALLGTPNHVTMAGNGRRILIYTFSESQAAGRSFAGVGASMLGSVLPLGHTASVVAGAGSVGASTVSGTSSRHQMLQINITKDNIVEDFEFSDNTTKSESGLGVTKTKTEKTAPEDKK